MTTHVLRAFTTEFDPQPYHLDDDAARETIFAGLAASGWHTAAIILRLMVDGELKPAGGIMGRLNHWCWDIAFMKAARAALCIAPL